jgi:hypothetical protein
MKKLIIICILCLFSIESKAQLTIHGTDATKFYWWDGQSLFKATSGEIWVIEPETGTQGTGIYNQNNLIWTQITSYPFGDGLGFNPGEKYVSCEEASNRYNDGDCGPKSNITVNGVIVPKCWNGNNNGCSIKLDNGQIIYGDNSGNF